MRKVIFLIHVSLDGFVAGPNGEMDWIVYNDDVEQYSYSLHDATDAAIYGRVTYQMMEGYWPTVLENPDAGSEIAHARWLEDATKIVFSKTLDSVEWKNTVLIHDHIAEEMTRIKQQPGKDMWLLGSPSLAQTFMRLGLIDEYRLNVNPVILGSGLPLFTDQNEILNLKLLEAQTFQGGVVALRYAPASQDA
ncbi:MAG: dihydrofolate reductase family protein [Anaerolineae bacterium]|nr:dihydrofolate reductase family protein [Anaerolineae bacterium]